MKKVNYDNPLSSIFVDGLFRFFAVVLLFVSLLYEQKNLILISILILLMFYGAKTWSYFSIRKIHYSFDAEKKKGFPGEKVKLQARISNNKLLPVWITLRIPIDKEIIKEDNNSINEDFYLLWYDQISWQWDLTATKRGCFQIGPPFLESGDLLGFFKKRKYLSESMEMIVYPRQIALNFISAPTKDLFGKPGITSPVKDPIYPISTQNYYPGDPAKHIHWKASARHSQLQSKIFEPSSQKKILFILDVTSFNSENQEQSFEKTLEVTAAYFLQLNEQGIPFGIITNSKMAGGYSTRLPIATGSDQLSEAMEFLARIQMEPEHPLEEILFQNKLLIGGIGVIFCAYKLDKINIQITGLLKEYNIPAYFIISEMPDLAIGSQPEIFLLEKLHGGYINNNI